MFKLVSVGGVKPDLSVSVPVDVKPLLAVPAVVASVSLSFHEIETLVVLPSVLISIVLFDGCIGIAIGASGVERSTDILTKLSALYVKVFPSPSILVKVNVVGIIQTSYPFLN